MKRKPHVSSFYKDQTLILMEQKAEAMERIKNLEDSLDDLTTELSRTKAHRLKLIEQVQDAWDFQGKIVIWMGLSVFVSIILASGIVAFLIWRKFHG